MADPIPKATIVMPTMNAGAAGFRNASMIGLPSTGSSGGSRIGTVVLVGALGVAGYFVYRHFKKKGK